jgi:hypothetical protein
VPAGIDVSAFTSGVGLGAFVATTAWAFATTLRIFRRMIEAE